MDKNRVTDDTIKNFYQEFISECLNQLKGVDMSRKNKKILRKIRKSVKRMNYNVFGYLVAVHINCLLELIDFDTNDPLYDVIMGAIDTISKYKSSENDIGEYSFSNPFSNNKIMSSSILPKVKGSNDISWLRKMPMQITVTKDGSIWVNNELWNYLIDTLEHEAFGNLPILYRDKNVVSKIKTIGLNIGFSGNRIITCINKGPSEYLNINFNKRVDGHGCSFGVAESTMNLSMALDEYMIGTYIMKETNVPGFLVGDKDTLIPDTIELKK